MSETNHDPIDISQDNHILEAALEMIMLKRIAAKTQPFKRSFFGLGPEKLNPTFLKVSEQAVRAHSEFWELVEKRYPRTKDGVWTLNYNKKTITYDPNDN